MFLFTTGKDTERVSIIKPLDNPRQTFNDIDSTYTDRSPSVLLDHDKVSSMHFH